jgi:hypothetical protein
MRKQIFSAMLLASMLTFATCGDDETIVPPDIAAGDYPVIEATANTVTIVAHFLVAPCNDVVLPGSYLLAEGTTDWITEPAQLLKFVPVGTIGETTWDGWYKVNVPINETTTAASGDLTYALGAKPVQLKDDGSFNWDYQSGDEERVKVLDGDVVLVAGYSGEANIFYTGPGVVVIEFDGWKNGNDPCVAKPTYNYTFTLTAPTATPDTAKVYIVGNFDTPYANWTADAASMVMTKGTGSTYTITLNNVAEGTEYKYLINGTWDNEEQTDTCSGVGNRLTGTSAAINDVVGNWKGVTCGVVGDVPAGTGTFTVTITGGYVEDSKIIFTGNFTEKAWGDSDREMTKGAGNTWTWTGDYPAKFEYKVIMRGASDTWASGDNAAFDGTNFSHDFAF